MQNLKENITVKQAIQIYEEKFDHLERFTLIAWIKKYNLGIKIGGRWFVKSELFLSFLNKGV